MDDYQAPKKSFPRLIVVIIVLLLATTLIFAYQNFKLKQKLTQIQLSPTSTPLVTTVPEDLTANWQIYKNDKYNLTFKYPNRFKSKNNYKADDYYETLNSLESSNGEVIFINIIKDVDIYKNNKVVDVARREVSDSGYKYSVTETKVADYSAAITLIDDVNVSSQSITIIHPTKNLFLVLVLPKAMSKAEFDLILSTFKFTDTKDETENWKTYSHNGISFQYPGGWAQKPEQLSGSGWSIEIADPQQVYTVTFSERGNYSQETGKPYTDLKEYVQMPYMNAVIVDGQQADKTLPRAGSENNNQVIFFSKDTKSIYTLELDTNRNRIDRLEEGQKIFDQILSTFKFLDFKKDIVLITQELLDKGWYYGSKEHKLSGTPLDWIYQDNGGSNCWHKPNVNCY